MRGTSSTGTGVRTFQGSNSYPGCVTSDGDPWADREGRNSLPRYVTEQPAKDFFIPYLNDPAKAEDLWSRFAARYAASRRVYSLTSTNNDQKIEVHVGRERKVFGRSGGRGGYVSGAEFDRRGKREGYKYVTIALVSRLRACHHSGHGHDEALPRSSMACASWLSTTRFRGARGRCWPCASASERDPG